MWSCLRKANNASSKRGWPPRSPPSTRRSPMCARRPQYPVAEYCKEHTKCRRLLPELLRASNDGIVRMLVKDGMLPNWTGKSCPRCEAGTLSKLIQSPNGKGLKHRCSRKGCQVYLSPAHLHPWFTDGNGTGSTPLQTQAAVLSMKLQNISLPATCHLLGHKLVEDITNRLTFARQDYVKEQQKTLTLGSITGEPEAPQTMG